MNPDRRYGVVLIALLAMFAIGCVGPFQGEDLPAESSAAASQTLFWNSISDAQSGDWFYLLNVGPEALEWRLRMIDSAQQSIDLETFLWKPDNSGHQIVAHILAAADRGVKVRFLLDDAFTMHEGLALHALDEHPNISFRLYNPYSNRSDSAFRRELFSAGEFSRTNHRMHNKAMVVDGRAALIGGRNLADEYFGLDDGLNFRDMEVITVGSSVSQVVDHLDGFWNSKWSVPIRDVITEPEGAPGLEDFRRQLALEVPMPEEQDFEALEAEWMVIATLAYLGRADFFFDQPASDNPAAPDDMPNQLAGELQRMIDAAETEVILVSAYLIPTPELEAVVEQVEARGVNVRILTNSLQSNNHLAAHAAYQKHLKRLIAHGADLHEVRTNAENRDLYMLSPVDDKKLGLHAKLLLVDDDISYIGSCNLDARSLKINTEVGLIIESEELNQALREHLAIDFKPGNAWSVQRRKHGKLVWVSDDEELNRQPADSAFQRLEDWFIGLLPIDKQM